MSHPYHVDERDFQFNLTECPGFDELRKLEPFEDVDDETVMMIFDQSKSFCQKVLAPLLGMSDRAGSVLEDGKVILPEELRHAWQQYRELGLIGMSSDADYGGGGLPHLLTVPVSEMECGSFVAFSMLPLLTRGAARLILNFGSDTLKDLYLEKMFTGEWTGTMCLTEPNAGSDVGAGATKAVPEGDHYKISGTKIFISWGEHELADNIIHLVLARTPGAPAGTKGLSLFVVPKYRLDGSGSPGDYNDVVCGSIEHKMGIKASPTCVINFGTENDTIGYLLGEECKGIAYMFQMMNEARIEVGIQGMGIASAAYLSALNYARERVQGTVTEAGGVRQAKIIEHPDVRRMLLKMRAIVEGTRAMLHHLMLYFDLGRLHPGQREKYQALTDLITPIAKSYGSDQGFRVTEMAVQTYGGYGYCQEYPVEQYMRDCKISSIYEGTNGIQALDLLLRKILMNRGASLQFWMEDVHALCASCQGLSVEELVVPMQTASGSVVETATHLGKIFAGGGDEAVRFHATDFQEAMGHIMVGYFLLRQAQTAAHKLTGDVNDRDRAFYEQKILTTRYFFQAMIPGAVYALGQMCEGEPVGLQAEFI